MDATFHGDGYMAAVPALLKNLRQWVCWGKAGADIRKCPYNPCNGDTAKAEQPQTWVQFEDALTAVRTGQYEGVGFEFAEGGGIVGVDFDHCLTDNILSPWVAEWVRVFDSYTEISPSRTGLHIFCIGKLPGANVKKTQAEMYDHARYFTVTGKVWGGEPKPIRNAQEAIDALYEELTTHTQHKPIRAHTAPLHGRQVFSQYIGKISSNDLYERGLREGKRLRARLQGYELNKKSPSENDAALLADIIFWSGRDASETVIKERFLASTYAQNMMVYDPKRRCGKYQRGDYLPGIIANIKSKMNIYASDMDKRQEWIDAQNAKKQIKKEPNKGGKPTTISPIVESLFLELLSTAENHEMPNIVLKNAIMDETGCSERLYKKVKQNLVESGKIESEMRLKINFCILLN